jgi:3'-5' exoribonuclease 1
MKMAVSMQVMLLLTLGRCALGRLQARPNAHAWRTGAAGARSGSTRSGSALPSLCALSGSDSALRPMPAGALEILLVLDVEATCDNPQRLPHEIIEWPVVAVDAATATTIGEFHRYVRPTEEPTLSAFCRKLTGITQPDVDAAMPLNVVLDEFDAWLTELGLFDAQTGARQRRWALATDGPWDLNHFCARECARKGIRERAHLREYVNVRKAHARALKLRTPRGCSLNGQLAKLGLTFEGRPHCGRDDARNIARVLCELLRMRTPYALSINEAADPAVVGRYVSVKHGQSVGVGGTSGIRGPKKARGKRNKERRAAEEHAAALATMAGADAMAAPAAVAAGAAAVPADARG